MSNDSMPTDDELIRVLRAALDQDASPKTRAWWEQYLRNVIAFRGLGIPQIRAHLAHWRAAVGIATWAQPDQVRIALKLFDSSFAEDKLAGILFLQDYVADQGVWQELMPRYAHLYTDGHIFDWNTCDWFCVRVLGPTILRNGLACARAIADWQHAPNLWQARSSVVAFVPVASDAHYYPLIYESCDSLIRRHERFAKTAVGWILHDMSKYDVDGVKAFIADHLADFSLESLRNALKYVPDHERTAYVAQLKAGSRHSTGTAGA